MTKPITLFLIIILFTSCGVSIKSVVDESATEKPYQNTLIVLSYERGSTRNFMNKLKEKIELEFRAENKRVDVYIYETRKNNDLTLNANSVIEREINDIILDSSKDLLLVFNPTNLSYMDGGLRSATYEIVGIDTSSKKEIWKAEFNSFSGLGPALLAEKSAKTIFEKLKTDKVL